MNSQDIAGVLEDHYAGGTLGHTAALEAAARIVSHSLMVCEISGPAANRFPVTVMRDLGRDLIVQGQANFLLALPLVHVIGGTIRKDGRIEWYEGGKRRDSGDYLSVNWTDAGDGQGRSALQNARSLWSIASEAERVEKEELSGNVSSIVAVPNSWKSNEQTKTDPPTKPGERPQDVLGRMVKTLRGKTALLPTVFQGERRKGNVPMQDWVQQKWQPRVDEKTLAIHSRAYDDVLRAIGVHPTSHVVRDFANEGYNENPHVPAHKSSRQADNRQRKAKRDDNRYRYFTIASR